MAEAGQTPPWRSVYTASAEAFIVANVRSASTADRIFAARRLLEEFPDMGRVYDPAYPAARPPFPCRVLAVPDTPFDLDYFKEEKTQTLVIFCIEYAAGDPRERFAELA